MKNAKDIKGNLKSVLWNIKNNKFSGSRGKDSLLIHTTIQKTLEWVLSDSKTKTLYDDFVEDATFSIKVAYRDIRDRSYDWPKKCIRGAATLGFVKQLLSEKV